MAEVVLEQVNKVFPGGVNAVRDMSLTVGDGTFLVLVGPSGCGKSTTLRLVAGLESVTSGTVRIGGVSVNDVPPKDRDVAMAFQNYALYPHISVYRNLALPLRLRGVPRAEIDRRVRETARLLDVETLLERKPKALSGGQRQRVALGRAMVRQPKAFLLDEPLSNLDARLRVDMRAELKRLHRRLQTTTIYVTHDQEEAMTLGDRIAVMKDGEILQVGSPLDVYHAPVDRFVATFVGTPPMNFLSGRLVAENGNVYWEDGTCRVGLSDDNAKAVAPWAGKEVVLGLRPEAIALRGEGRFAGRDNTVSGHVSVVEPLGEKMDVFCSADGRSSIVARVDAQADIRPGQPVVLHFDMQKAHVFEPTPAGRNLSLALG